MRETIQNANGKQFHAVSLSGGKDSNALKRLPYKLRYAAVLCNKGYGITLAKVGGNAPKRIMPWKVSQRWDMCMIRRRSINCLWSECHG